MKSVKKTVRTLLLAALICVMLSTVVFAADNGSVWLSATETSGAEGTAALIVTDTTVTDGLVELTYDSSKLTYQGVEVTKAYVAMYSVNADEAGVVRISWVAPEAYETDGSGICLIQVNFSGVEEGSGMTLSGSVRDGEGNEVAFGTAPDTTELEKAILEAQGLDETKYTEESFEELKEALAAAEAVLADPAASQSQVDAAAKALYAAMDALELKGTGDTTPGETDKTELEKAIAKAEGLDESKYTKESYADLEKALKDAKAVLDDADATQDEVDAAAKALKDAIAALALATGKNPGTGDHSMVIPAICIGVVAVAGMAVLLFVLIRNKKKERDGK